MLKLRLLILLLFLPGIGGLGQTRQTTDNLPAAEPLYILASVSNKDGNPIQGLKQENFQVSIDGIPQKIERLIEADEPWSIGIVADASGSIQTSAKTRDLSQAILRFSALSNKQNEYFLIAFNVQPQLLMDWAPNLEPGLASLIIIKPQGNSALFDALYVAGEKANRGRHRKRALIVISDGQDNLSRYSFNELREYLKEIDVNLYVIGLNIEGTAGSALAKEGRTLLDELSKLSGGISIFPRYDRRWRAEELITAGEMIAGSLRHQYKIRLTPTYNSTEKWHRIKIRVHVTNPPKELKDLSVRAREGFYLQRPAKEEE